MAQCTAPIRGHRTAAAAAACPVCGGRRSYYHQIGYNTYQNVLKKFKKRKSMYFDQVVEIGHYQLGIKGKKVLVVYDEDIDDFYHHYINYIQK